MPWDRARDALDEIHRLRSANEPAAVLAVAEGLWARAAGWDRERRTGLAAVCQAAFVALMAAGDEDSLARAPLWRARATRVAAETGEVAAAAMLLIPLAAETAARGHLATALDVLDELGAAADVVAQGGTPVVEPPLAVLRRTHLEKQGHLLWRAECYTEARERYEGALAVARPGRDALRVRGGLVLARLGVEVAAGNEVDRPAEAAALRAIADEAAAGGWLDVAEPAAEAAAIVGGAAPLEVQALPCFEIEPGPARSG